MKEFRKIVRNNFFFNVKISSNRCQLAGSYPIAIRRQMNLRRSAGNDNQNTDIDPSIDYPLPPTSTKRSTRSRRGY
jgi:hypothetical protein